MKKKEEKTMAEDFTGVSGALTEQFVGAENSKLFEEPFEALELRLAKEKPALLPGLKLLQEKMGAVEFTRLISPLLNINQSGRALLLVSGDERLRTALTAKWLPALREAFDVDSVRIVGGGRNGMDAY